MFQVKKNATDDDGLPQINTGITHFNLLLSFSLQICRKLVFTFSAILMKLSGASDEHIDKLLHSYEV